MPTPGSAGEWKQHWAREREIFDLDPRGHFRSYMREYRTWSSRSMLAIVNNYLEGFYMARGKTNAKPAPANRDQWTQFVDIPLTEDEFDAIPAAFPNLEAIDEAVCELLEKGYRLSVSFNEKSDAFICSVTCKDTESPNNGKTFNAFAGDWVSALQCALYKHFVKSGRLWGDPENKPARPRFG